MDANDRLTKLGFSPQKELVYNRLLPYADKLDDESSEQLAVIKANLGTAIQLRDLKIGATHWTCQLTKYIRIQGYKFSKEDHVLFIRLLYELLTIPDLDYSLIQKYSLLLVTLLKKKDLLTRDDLVLPWRPLYKLVADIAYSPYEHHGLVLFPANIENVVKNVVRVSRVYFSIEATQEMLDEWRPLLCPFDVTMMRGMSYFELFLPTSLPPEHHDRGYKLWFEEFIQIWDSCQNSPSWEAKLVGLFARLAYGCLGYIDWQPYMSKIFTRFLRGFNLPVGSGQVLVSRNGSCYDVIPMAWLIVSMLGGGSTCQDHLNRLFKSLESFYHPSNSGKWNMKLMKLMLKLPQNMLRRLYRERDKKTWFPNVLESSRLTDSDVTEFVQCLKPIVLLAMFSKTGLHDPAATIQYLAALDVKSILPPLLERTYPALENLVEPHRLISCLHCTVSGARSMIANHELYPEGRLHVIPLLCLSLPGIDSNDCKKCLMTFQLISTLVCLVPLVDCSSAVQEKSDLSEDEVELCLVTAQFEDFVTQFMRKLFDLIENCAQEHMSSAIHKKLNHEEMILEAGLLSAFNAVVQQCSEKIYLMILKKLQNYICSTVHELVVAGRYTADLIRTIIKVKPEKGLKTFIMQFIDTLKTWCTSNEDVAKEEHLDNDFLWNLKMLSEIVKCDGSALLPYQQELISVLRLTLDLKCKEAADLAGFLLKHLLKALTTTFALDYRNTSTDWNLPFSQQLPIRDWGRKGDLQDLQMKWHIPSPEEKEFTREVLKTFLLPQLHKVNDYVKGGDDTMTRDELLRCLTIIEQCLLGAACLLPVLQGDQVLLIESLIELKRFNNIAAVDQESVDVEGQNTRQLVVDALRPLLEYLLQKHEDDTKSLIAIAKVYNCVLFNFGMVKEEFDGKWKSLFYYKKSMENKLLGKKNHMRALLVDRVQLQHEMRLVNRASKVVTPSHVNLLQDLFRLSISRYSEVRKVGQWNLSRAFALFAYSNRAVLDDIIHCLREDSTDSELHHQFKGALYVILGESKSSLITKRSWDVMNRLWPRLVQAQHSEKPSDLQLVDTIIDKLHKNIETTEVSIKCHDSLLAVASELWSSGNVPKPATPPPSASEQEEGRKKEDARNALSLQSYEKLMKALGDSVDSGSLRWKFHEIAMEMLSLMVRYDVPCSAQTVRIFVSNTVHDSLQVRKLCIGTLSAILKVQKRRHKLQEIDPYKVSGTTRPSDPNTVHPGDRLDNKWMHYDPSGQPYASKQRWDSQTLVEKTHWGYYCWPSSMYTYAPESEQPPLGRAVDNLSAAERVIYAHFSQTEFIEKLFRFMSQEENKGKDKFHPKVFILFKGLFRNFDEAFLPLMKPHIERMVQDTSRDTHDSNQRCAAEFITGLIRGSKHWHYDMLKSMWDWLLPVLRTALSNMTVETISDWGTCFATSTESRDPRKLAPFLQLVLENPLRGNGGSFGDSSRLYVLQGALAQQEWRVPQMLHDLLTYLTPQLAHTYKNVRDRLGSLLVNVFLYDFVLPGGGESLSPHRAPFLNQLAEQLSFLQNSEGINGASNGGDSKSTSTEVTNPAGLEDEAMPCGSPEESGNGENGAVDKDNDERKVAIRTCKTLLRWFQGSFSRMFNCVPPEIFKFIPIICSLSSERQDDELRYDCRVTLACMAQAMLPPNVIPILLDTIRQVSVMSSWHARAAILNYTQVMVFGNLFLLQQPHFMDEIQQLVLRLLRDDQVEVREKAAVTLSGLLQCGYLTVDIQLVTEFEKWSSRKLKKKRSDVRPEDLLHRHAGVLGLSAVVQAFPYDVPPLMPQVLMALSQHVNDPQPIQTTVKRTLLNFKRTHLDNWNDHKLMFTDDQLVVLTDLLVSPNYYA